MATILQCFRQYLEQLAKSFEILESRLMHELYQIRMLLSHLSAIGGQHQPYQPLGPYIQQYYPPIPADYMGMVPKVQPQQVAATDTPTIPDMPEPEPITPNQTFKEFLSTSPKNQPFVLNTTTAVPDEAFNTTEAPPTSTTTTSRNISFKPVQTKSLKLPQKPIARKKLIT